jgi:hypothetical protein
MVIAAVLMDMRENIENASRAAWRDFGTTPPTMATLWHPERIAVVPLLEAGRPEEGTRAAVAELGAQAYVLVFSEAVRLPEGGREWCLFVLWGGCDGQYGGEVFPLKQTPLHGRYFGQGRGWMDGAREVWETVFGTPPVAPTVQ